ncbi:MAG TPA: ATP-binding cassette domain-containing protein [Clostridiales bacterium]|nr:ATP-binding cassette domain-containing protein [Clostridiales bacterium]
MSELLKIDHLSYTCHNNGRETPVLLDVSFHVMEGEIVSIVGKSGCGKSTLLSLIAGIHTPDSGSIHICGKDLKASGKSIGYMMQKDNVCDSCKNGSGNSDCPQEQPESPGNTYVQINGYAKTYGMITFIGTYPNKEATCARQRITFLRSLLTEPDLLLLDEPFANLDEKTRAEVSEDMFQLLRKEKKTVLLATGNMEEARRLSDRIIPLDSIKACHIPM